MKFLKSILLSLVSIIFKFLYRLTHLTPQSRGVWFEAQPPSTFCINTFGKVKYVLNTSDKVIAKSIYKTGFYDCDKLIEALQLLPYGHTRTILADVGANIGPISLEALSRNLFQKAIAIEPEPANFKLLRANAIINSLEDKLTLFNVAAGSTDDAKLQFELSEDNFGDHRVQFGEGVDNKNEKKRECLEVDSLTLDTILSDQPHENLLVWIDTQGFEAYVLSGAQSLIQKNVPFVIEFYPSGLQRSNSFEMLNEKLQSFDYYIDLNSTDQKPVKMSTEAIEKLASQFGGEIKFTDILVYKSIRNKPLMHND